jgi:excisionase family DNA binding protein
MSDSRHCTKAEAAALLGCSERTIERLVEAGRLTIDRWHEGRVWFRTAAVSRVAKARIEQHISPPTAPASTRRGVRFT